MKSKPPFQLPSAVKSGSKTTEITTAFSDIGLPALKVLPAVFNPEFSFSGKFLAHTIFRHTDLFVGKRVLDVGCGCGILGLTCMVCGAMRLVATDISENAAQNAKVNAKMLGFSIEAVSGDLFQAVQKQKFDIVVFNPPGFEGVPVSEVEAHYHCPIEVLERFYSTVPEYLSEDGVILSATSDIHDSTRSPLAFASKLGYGIELLHSADSQYGKQYAYLIRANG